LLGWKLNLMHQTLASTRKGDKYNELFITSYDYANRENLHRPWKQSSEKCVKHGNFRPQDGRMAKLVAGEMLRLMILS
jgi:hypothetical protein